MKKNLWFIDVALPVWWTMIIISGSLPGDQVPPLGFWNIDKVAHGAEYCLLAMLLVRFLDRHWNMRVIWMVVTAVGVAALFGGAEEIHQFFIPGRSCSLFDFFADTSGAIAGSLISGRAVFLQQEKAGLSAVDNSKKLSGL